MAVTNASINVSKDAASAQNTVQGNLCDVSLSPPRSRRGVSVPDHEKYVACADCAFYKPCGGLDQGAAWGCSSHCASCVKITKQGIAHWVYGSKGTTCDFTCFERPRALTQRMQEVGGFDRMECNAIIPIPNVDLPPYVPVVYNASSRKRVLNIPFVAIPFHRVLKERSDKRYRPNSDTPAGLRDEFKIPPEAQVIITGVAYDWFIERYWRFAELHAAASELAKLGVRGMTAPNYSYFTDVPRVQILYNRRRALITSDLLTTAGVPLIPHINAISQGDWRFWESFLKEQTQIIVVAKEFR